MVGRIWNFRKKGVGGRVFGEVFNLIGLVSAGLALGLEVSKATVGESQDDMKIATASLWLAIAAGIAVTLAGASVLYYATRHMDRTAGDAALARRLAFGRGLLWVLFAGGAALLAGLLGFVEVDPLTIVVLGGLSMVGWAFGECLNIGQQIIGNRVEGDALVKLRNSIDAACSGAKAVGILLMFTGGFLPFEAKVGTLMAGAVIAAIGATVNLLLGAIKLIHRVTQ